MIWGRFYLHFSLFWHTKTTNYNELSYNRLMNKTDSLIFWLTDQLTSAWSNCPKSSGEVRLSLPRNLLVGGAWKWGVKWSGWSDGEVGVRTPAVPPSNSSPAIDRLIGWWLIGKNQQSRWRLSTRRKTKIIGQYKKQLKQVKHTNATELS